MSNIRTWFLRQPLDGKRDATLLSLFLCCLILGQLGRFSPWSTIALYPHDLVIIIWLLLRPRMIWALMVTALRWVRHHPLLIATLVWIALGLSLSLLVAPQLRPWLLLARLCAYALFAGTVAQVYRRERVGLRSALVVAGNLILWLGLVQYVLLPDTRFLAIQGWDDHYYRLIGPLFDPNFMGMMIVLVMIFTASVHWLLPKKAQIVLQSYYGALLALTYSRASYATASLSALLLVSVPYPLKYWRFWQRISLFTIVTLVFGLVLLLAPKPGGEGVKLLRTSSISARQNTATQTIDHLSTTDLLFGRGLFSMVTPQPAATAETALSSATDSAVRTSSINFQPIATNATGTSSIKSSATISAANTTALTADTTTASTLVPDQHAQVPDNILLLLLSGTGVIGTVLVLSSLLYWIGVLSKKETAGAIALGVTLLHAQFNNTFFEPFIMLYLLLAVCAPLDQTQQSTRSLNHFREKKAGENDTATPAEASGI